MKAAVSFGLAILLLVNVDYSLASEPCQIRDGFDQIIAMCGVVKNGMIDSKAAFEITNGYLCVRKRSVNFDSGPSIGYSVEGELDGKYIKSLQSDDGLFPGEKNDPPYKPNELLREDDHTFLVSGYVKPDGKAMSWEGMKAEIKKDVLKITNVDLDGMDNYYQYYRKDVKYDLKSKILQLSYDRDYGVIPLIKSWKPLLNFSLQCE